MAYEYGLYEYFTKPNTSSFHIVWDKDLLVHLEKIQKMDLTKLFWVIYRRDAQKEGQHELFMTYPFCVGCNPSQQEMVAQLKRIERLMQSPNLRKFQDRLAQINQAYHPIDYRVLRMHVRALSKL